MSGRYGSKPSSRTDRGGGHMGTVLRGHQVQHQRPASLPPGSTLSVACPSEQCDAPIGVKCRTAAGKETSSHPGRVRMATRADNARREAEGTLDQRRGFGNVDKDNGRACPFCGASIRTDRGGTVLVTHGRGGTVRSGANCPGSRLRLPAVGDLPYVVDLVKRPPLRQD